MFSRRDAPLCTARSGVQSRELIPLFPCANRAFPPFSPSQPFNKYLEIGRVCLINYGPDAGKLCTVLDFVDHNRVLVDGPLKLTGVGRQSIPIRWIVLTKLHVKIPFACNQKCLLKALEAVYSFFFRLHIYIAHFFFNFISFFLVI